jgi:hypothetical protein
MLFRWDSDSSRSHDVRVDRQIEGNAPGPRRHFMDREIFDPHSRMKDCRLMSADKQQIHTRRLFKIHFESTAGGRGCGQDLRCIFASGPQRLFAGPFPHVADGAALQLDFQRRQGGVILLGGRNRCRQWRLAKQCEIPARGSKSVACPWSFDFGRTLDHIDRGHLRRCHD